MNRVYFIIICLIIIFIIIYTYSSQNSHEGFIGNYVNKVCRPYYREAKKHYNNHTTYYTNTVNSVVTYCKRMFIF